MTTITLEHVSKSFGRGDGRAVAVQDLTLSVPAGRTLVILGPSGCGKTTVLKIIAGLVKPDAGRIFFGERDVGALPARERGIGMVFQEFALYPNLNARGNVLSYFLFRKRTPELDAEAREKYQRTSDLMGVDLEHLLHRMPRGMSPGEKQRVGLARAITRDPSVMLLDEPFSHLDRVLRDRYRLNLRRLLRELRLTAVYVTHDQHEAPMMADRVALMKEGRIVQVGSYDELYRSPRNAFVAGFLSPDPLAPAISLLEGATVSSTFGGMRVGVRPEDVTVLLNESWRQTGDIGIAADVVERTSIPARAADLLLLEAEGFGDRQTIFAYLAPPGVALPPRVWLRFDRFHLFESGSGNVVQSYP